MAGVATVLCVGCGPVRLQSLTPTVWKPSALFLLDGTVPGWNPADARRIAGAAEVVAQAVYGSSAALPEQLNRALTEMPHVGLFVVVASQTLPSQMTQWASQHVQTRLEWVSPASVNSNAVNVRQLTGDAVATGYLTGWLAGYAAAVGGTDTVGWDLQSPAVSRRMVEAALGGTYVANTKVQNVSFSLQSPALGAVSTVVGVPNWVVVDYPLTPTAVSNARRAGCNVLSLVPQPTFGASILTVPGVPSPDAVKMVLTAFRKLSWTAGAAHSGFAQAPLSISSALPSSTLSQLSTQEALMATDPSWAAQAWSVVPQAVRQNWALLLS